MVVELERTRTDWFRACFVVLFLSGIAFLLIVYPASKAVLQMVVEAVELSLVLIALSIVVALIIRAIPPLRGLWLHPLVIELCLTPETLRSGEPFSYSIGVTLDRRMTIQSWAVTLIGIHEWQGKHELEGDRISEVTARNILHLRYPAGQRIDFHGSLFVPKGSPPSSKGNTEEVRWVVAIEMRAFLKHRFIGRVPVTVLPAER